MAEQDGGHPLDDTFPSGYPHVRTDPSNSWNLNFEHLLIRLANNAHVLRVPPHSHGTLLEKRVVQGVPPLFFSGILLSRKTSNKNSEKDRFLKKAVVEKNGETIPRVLEIPPAPRSCLSVRHSPGQLLEYRYMFLKKNMS